MKRTTLLHNPTAGDNDFSKKELLKIIKKEGFECEYASVKEEGWDEFEEKTDFLIIAGGDGTVRRAAKALMQRKRLDKQFPLALLPHGTANNIATALQIEGHPKDIIPHWHHYKLQPFDIGRVHGVRDDLFFLEAFGYGIFPRLMKVMDKIEGDIGDTAEEKLKAARAVLLEIVQTYEARPCTIVADGVEHSGNYIMVEVMNIRSIGPNLVLAGTADPGDGCLDVVMVSEASRNKFESFLLSRINDEDKEFSFSTIRAKKVKIFWDGKDAHADDERLKLEKPVEVEIEVLPDMLQFMITES
ncbi:diacylglycerol/lipid kinase family protein [Dyadobacter fermentans]|uniref:Diacylglycerol kinase catalytic region n=1 Tax=Dyadobacter fermentans (strain ATCC 700827 / DSM 18053 / CIP 107007 / KCTC 52180 / NS114) TaxID=471854 RepID=C6VYJ6_DYAFD|nr:diacylglycerol kinase family protein [Dyadobacter fermentans]ACT91675.1 diacylglycerol kinase catalytic region [Dyadobacter fermentans DSM 18053]